MSRRDPIASFGHMRDYALIGIEMSQKYCRQDLDDDRIAMLAATRVLEIVGEAANRITLEVRAQHPQIDWVNIINLRHRMAHGYDNVDLDTVWQVLAEELPPLVKYIDTFVPADPPVA